MNHAEKVKSLLAELDDSHGGKLPSTSSMRTEAELHAAIDEMQAEIDAFKKDAERFRALESLAKEKLVNPKGFMCEYLSDRRTHWILPILMCSGPIGGYKTFAEAVDGLTEKDDDGD